MTCACLAQETLEHISSSTSLTGQHHDHVVRGMQERPEAMASMPPWLSTAAHLDFSHVRPHSPKRALLFPFWGARRSTTPSGVRLNVMWSPHLAWPLPSAFVSHSRSLLRRRLALLRPQLQRPLHSTWSTPEHLEQASGNEATVHAVLAVHSRRDSKYGRGMYTSCVRLLYPNCVLLSCASVR